MFSFLATARNLAGDTAKNRITPCFRVSPVTRADDRGNLGPLAYDSEMTQVIRENKLVDAPRCIDAIFHEEARPGLRTWMDWKAKGYLPFVRVGRRIFYDPAACRAALEKRFTIRDR